MTESPKMITTKYILKLIPIERRLFLPSLKLNGKTIYIKLENSDTITEVKNESIEILILRAIRDKTGLIFLAPKYQLSYFVPRCLRELREFLIFLNGLGKEKDKNLQAFKNYFVRNWCNNEIDKDYLDLVTEWLDKMYSKRNKFFIVNTLDTLRDLFITKYSKKNESIREVLEWHGIFSDSIHEVSKKDNYAINISLGDVLFVIKQLEFINDSAITKYCFAIKALYSIEMLSLLNNSYHLGDRLENITDSEEKEKCMQLEYSSLEELFEIIGGQFIPESNRLLDSDHIRYDILPRDSINRESRQSFNINYGKDYFSTEHTKVSEGERNTTTKPEGEKISFVEKLNKYRYQLAQYQIDPNRIDSTEMAGFFESENMLLFQFFILKLGEGNYLNRRNSDDEAYYGKRLSFGKIKNKAKFDLFTLFWTSIFPEKIWERNNLPKDYIFKGVFKKLIDNRREGKILFPLYSIDLINKRFIKSKFKYSFTGLVDWKDDSLYLINYLQKEGESLGFEKSLKSDVFLNDGKLQNHLLYTLQDITNNRIREIKNEDLIDKNKIINNFINDRLANLRYVFIPKKSDSLSGKTVISRINIEFTGEKGLNQVTDIWPKINDLKDKINNIKGQIDNKKRFKEIDLMKIYDNIVQIIDLWKKDNLN